MFLLRNRIRKISLGRKTKKFMWNHRRSSKLSKQLFSLDEEVGENPDGLQILDVPSSFIIIVQDVIRLANEIVRSSTDVEMIDAPSSLLIEFPP